MRRHSTGFGVRVCLEVAEPASAALDAVLPYWWRDEEPAGDAETFAVPDAATAAEVVGALELWVAEHAAGLVFVHAGVVALGGRALLLPGRSFAGKSTLTAELVRRGWAYGSDEYAVLQPDGLVLPYPRRIALRTADGVRRVSASELGGAEAVGLLEVAAVADLQYLAGVSPTLTPQSVGITALRLLDNAVCAASRPAEALDAVTRAVAGAHCAGGTRGEAVGIADALLDLMGQGP